MSEEELNQLRPMDGELTWGRRDNAFYIARLRSDVDLILFRLCGSSTDFSQVQIVIRLHGFHGAAFEEVPEFNAGTFCYSGNLLSFGKRLLASGACSDILRVSICEEIAISVSPIDIDGMGLFRLDMEYLHRGRSSLNSGWEFIIMNLDVVCHLGVLKLPGELGRDLIEFLEKSGHNFDTPYQGFTG